jgi:hypothetical protein
MPRAAASPTETGVLGKTGKGAAVSPDGYKDKLIKYVPAEVLAFYTPLAAALTARTDLLITIAIAGLIATPIYLWYAASGKPKAERPLKHFYVLSALAFVAWAMCTSALGVTLGLSPVVASVILGITVLFLPPLDALLARAGI